MEDIVLVSLPKTEFESLIENAIRKVLAEILPDQNKSIDDSFMSTIETAGFLKVSVPTIYSYVHSRKIPCCKRGKRLYFPKADLIQWIKEGKLKTDEEIRQEVDSYFAKGKQRTRFRNN